MRQPWRDYRPSARRAYHRGVDSSFDGLVTNRLLLRRFTAQDADTFAAYRSIPEVARFQSWDAPYPVERARGLIAWLLGHHPDEPGEWYQIAIAERAAPERLVGDCGFRARIDEPAIVDIGFTLQPAVQGRGYATEAIGELLRYLFEDRGKHKVCADCDTRNDPSWRLLERLGFGREGMLRESYRDGEAWADEYLYGILTANWHTRRAPA
jgi:RimJ/RimL family protein N-acetyltransferase